MKDRVFRSRTLPSELTTAINNCCSKRQYVFKYWRKNFAVVNFLVSVPRKFKLLSSCISYGVKKTNIAGNKNYWHSKKCLSLFICWLFSVTRWNILSHSKFFFSEQRNKMFFSFFYFTYQRLFTIQQKFPMNIKIFSLFG